ncbi:MAG TPA: ABC transporter substrate-binding protein [Stellaceae bacterium]|jgi:ABC-type nitrate/sulfonate/bicarbonate transport system substrate-binding protein|nr:ABC transporter substrate-binding protein [Stellaceae bacterium]
MNRRSILLAGLALPAAAGLRATAAPLQKVKVVIPENSVFVLSWLGAKDAGVFTKHGIDLEVDVRPFAGFLAGLPSKECMAATYSGIDAIEKINQGVDWAIIGGGLTLMEDVIVRKDSPFQKVGDLRGKKFGTFSTGAGSFKAARAAIIDAEGFDIAKDAKLVQLAAPALLKLLANGTVDAMINISSFTIRAAAQPDKFRTIFVPNEYWKKKTGYPIVWTAPLVAWRSWVEQDRERASNLAAATAESFRWLRMPANLDAAVKAHGTLAGVTDPATINTYKEWLAAKRMFMTRWDKKAVDAQWQFLEMAKTRGVLDKVPDEHKYALLVEPDSKEKSG